MNIIVAGWIAPFPMAGYFWHAVSYALGFRALGHDVWYLEDSGDEPWGWDPRTSTLDPQCRAGVAFLEDEMALVGLGDRWAFRHHPTGHYSGMSESRVAEVIATADVLVNVSCLLPIRADVARIPHRIAIDTDPVFTQVHIARGHAKLASVPETHTRLFSFGRPPLPAASHEWVPTRQAVAADAWPVAPPPDPSAPLTSVMTWRAYPPVSYAGRDYGGRDWSFGPYVGLPSKTSARLSIALGAGEEQEEGIELLRGNGWETTDPIEATRTTDRYREFIAASLGELGVAKHGYVVSRSGWFSDRTSCYLASGRPAIVQDTGLSDWLTTGEGLLTFTSPNEALQCIEEVREEPARHAAAARAIAETELAADLVCQGLLDAL